MKQRIDRVADMIRAELANILQREVKDPRVRLATISTVQVARDLGHAKISVSVLGSDEDRAACIQALQKARGFFRSTLASRLSLRTTPELHFELDRGAEYSQRIDELLESVREPPGES
jgi:ribosome-binding factor A